MEETLTINILRKTKLIATIGPACEDPTTLRELFLNGVNVARLNLSHGSQDDHVALVKRIRKVAGDGDFNVAIMACLLYTSPSPRDGLLSRMPSSA